MRSYRERLRVPLLWWFLAGINILIIGSAIWAGLGGYWPAVTYVVLCLLVVPIMLNWDLAVIEVTDGTLRAGRDTLRLDKVANVVALDEEESAVLRGPRADPAAHLLLRPYLKKSVYVGLDDPSSPVPYWLVATRHPVELAAAIEASARQTVGR